MEMFLVAATLVASVYYAVRQTTVSGIVANCCGIITLAVISIYNYKEVVNLINDLL